MGNKTNTEGRNTKPTLQNILEAKKFIRARISAANALGNLVDNILVEAAGEIAEICLKYNIPAKSFTIRANINMCKEVFLVLDRIEGEILDLMESYSLMAAKDDERRNALFLYMAALGKNKMNLQDMLDGYLFRYLYDLEALIAANKLQMEDNKALSIASVIAKIKAVQHSVYTSPEVKTAMSVKNINAMQAAYIRTRGVHKDDTGLSTVGVSNSNTNNVVNMAKNTLSMVWMKNLELDFSEDKRMVGYYVMRGSSYPCTLCDSEVGFHPMKDIGHLPQYHAHCACIAIPIFK